MKLTEYFNAFKEFADIVPGIDSSLSFDILNSSANAAFKLISGIITQPVIKSLSDEAKSYFLIALANLTMAKEVPYDTLRKRKNNIDVFKSEQEAVTRGYIDGYYCAMDSLIGQLDTEATDEWKATSYYKMRDNLIVKDTLTFDSYYPIDQSYLFFHRCIPLQKEVISLKIGDLKSQIATKNEDDATDKLNRCVVLYTIVMALRRFDIVEFPATIRSLFVEQKSQRQGGEDQSRIIQLAEDLTDQANSILTSLQQLTDDNDDDNNNIETQTSFNQPDDIIILMP